MSISLITLELTNTNDVKLKAALEQFTLNLGCDAIKANMALGYHRARCDICGRHCQVNLEDLMVIQQEFCTRRVAAQWSEVV